MQLFYNSKENRLRTGYFNIHRKREREITSFCKYNSIFFSSSSFYLSVSTSLNIIFEIIINCVKGKGKTNDDDDDKGKWPKFVSNLHSFCVHRM